MTDLPAMTKQRSREAMERCNAATPDWISAGPVGAGLLVESRDGVPIAVFYGARTNPRSVTDVVFATRARADLPAALAMLTRAMAEVLHLWHGGLRSPRTAELLKEYYGGEIPTMRGSG